MALLSGEPARLPSTASTSGPGGALAFGDRFELGSSSWNTVSPTASAVRPRRARRSSDALLPGICERREVRHAGVARNPRGDPESPTKTHREGAESAEP